MLHILAADTRQPCKPSQHLNENQLQSLTLGDLQERLCPFSVRPELAEG
jgi:hypothetical protein